MESIGFIGVGVMGKSMVRNLMKNGFSVSIYTRTKSKALDVIDEGAVWYDTIAECVHSVDAVITIVGYPGDVEEVYFGDDGILKNAAAGTYLIDMTTTSPKLSRRIYDAAATKGMSALDARFREVIQAQEMLPCPLWWAEIGMLLMPVSQFSGPWVAI